MENRRHYDITFLDVAGITANFLLVIWLSIFDTVVAVLQHRKWIYYASQPRVWSLAAHYKL